VTVLVLDLDGVVVRSHPEGGRWDRHIERDLGLKPSHLQERFFRPHFRKIVTGEADLYETLERIWPELECAATPRALVDYWFAADSDLDQDVLAQVDAWRAAGNKAYLGTVQEHHRARYLMQTLGLARHFDDILYAAALGAAKPDPLFYERAQAKLPVASPGDVLFLDDSLKNVEAANAFGWRASHFKSADDLRAALAAAD
jgi:putative hydrolase of the HAD superfamily